MLRRHLEGAVGLRAGVALRLMAAIMMMIALLREGESALGMIVVVPGGVAFARRLLEKVVHPVRWRRGQRRDRRIRSRPGKIWIGGRA